MKDTETSAVCRCNRLFGKRTLHPLASVIDLHGQCCGQRTELDCYAVMLAERRPDDTGHCPCSCDYTAAEVAFATPGSHIGHEDGAEGRLLLFHPDLTRPDSLGARMPRYTYFGYGRHETLHLSLREKRQLERCIDMIDEELHWGVDRFSRTLLCNKIELLLNFCLRFYARQFILRHDISLDTLGRVTASIDDYLRSGRAAAEGLPRPGLVASWAGHSEAYTSDMLLAETGFATDDYVEKRRMDVAKQMLIGTGMATGEIAARLGFGGEEAFCRLFERCAGCTAADYRHR